MYLVVEVWKAKQAWLVLPRKERHAFLNDMGDQLAGLKEAGIELIGNGDVDLDFSQCVL
ncbi:DUF6616 family protein [Streptomyces cupreus]|uniref:Uncharacterized protein n=1 Tax=Streptomyces cupreus TaxID=2759956 RepID=A0A7X1J6W2_9ACTN|nr:DUF6616 family protein [Streptomyces cupreus]MBC2904700.1 hypothetical protein [Streptomyces cupreus]